MKIRWVALSCCFAVVAILAFAQTADEGYQMAKVVSFEKVAANAQHPENAGQYKIYLRLGNIVYSCRASGPIADFMGWSQGKEFPAQLNEKGKTILVKGPNAEVQLRIVGKKTPK